VGRIIDCALNNKVFHVTGNGNDTRDYTFIEDVVEAIQKAVEKDALNEEINIGTGIETSVDDLCEYIAALTRWNNVCFYDEKRAIDKIRRRYLDVRLAKRVLDWEPKTELRKGLKKTIEWFNAELYSDIPGKVSKGTV
jgi:nucleoside-diphosphate-sugar epimerase